MKVHHYSSPVTRSLRTAAMLAGLAAATGALAQNQQDQSSSSTRKADNRQMSDVNSTAPDAANVRVTRASNFLGTDVTASDGRKVGDITDYVFDVSGAPHLKYVIVVTDGFLGFGGDTRAVPAAAISTQGDGARLEIDSERYWDVAVIPQNRVRFLNNQRNTDQLSRDFNLADGSNRMANASDRTRANSSARPNQTQMQTEGQRSRSQNPSSQNEASSLVTFSELQNSDFYGSDGQRLGSFVDTWLSLDRNRAPYVEIASPPPPFHLTPRTRYAIPMNQLQTNADDDSWQFTFSITDEELQTAEMISETDGVKILQSDEIGRKILRVRVAAR